MNKSKIFYRILRADMVIVLVLVALMIPLSYQMVNTTRVSKLEDSYNTIQNGLNVLSSQIENLQNILTKAFVNDNFSRVSIIGSEIQNSDYYAILKAQQYIAAIASSNSYVADIVITFESNDIILTKETSFTNSEAFKQYYSIGGLEDTMLAKGKSSVQSAYYFDYYAETTFSYRSATMGYENAKDVFCYRVPIGSSPHTRGSGVAYIFIDKKLVLDTALPKSLHNNGFFNLLDNRRNMILTYGTNLILVDYEGIKYNNRKINGEEYSIINASNRTDTLYVVAGIPEAYFISSLRNVFIIIGIYIVMAALLGILISYIVAQRQSAPLKRLLSELEVRGFSLESNRDEYEFIANSLKQMESEKKDIFEQLDRFRNTLKSNMIEQLLNSRKLTADWQKNIKANFQDFPPHYIVGYGEFKTYVKGDKQSLDVMYLLASGRMKDMLPGDTIFHNINESSFALIVPSDESCTITETLQNIMNKINEDVPSKIVMAISSPNTGMDNVNTAFEQARLVYSIGDKDKYLLTPSDISSTSTFDIKDYLELYRYLVSADYTAVEQYIQNMFNQSDIPQSDLEQIYYIIRMTLLFATRDYVDKPIIIPKYQPNQSPEQMIETLCRIGGDICDIIDSNKRSHNVELKDEILSYIKQNFYSSEVYSKQIADRFSVSEKYLYNFIKEQTGYSLGEYLQYLRLELAADILKNSNKKISSLYEECGFNSQNTFYKAFKRAFGVSPSEYRERFSQVSSEI